MRCPPTLSLLLMLGAPLWGVPLACAALPEAQASPATVLEVPQATNNATLPATASNATLPATASNATLPATATEPATGNATKATPSLGALEEGPAVKANAAPAKNATSIKKNATKRAPSPTPSAPVRPTTHSAANGTAQQIAPAKHTPQQKLPAQGANATQESAPLTQNSTQSAPGEKDGWIVIEQGTRPVYAGIHGGTVPLTVLRASNGALFALAGETGSDFMNVLRGNTTGTGRGAAAQATLQEEKAAELPTAEAPLPQAENSVPESTHQTQERQAAPSGQNNATAQANVLQPIVSPMATANSTAPAAGKPAPAAPLAPVVHAPSPTAKAAAPAPKGPAAPPIAEKAPSAKATPPLEQTIEPPKDPMVAKLLGIPPPEADLVIASSDLAHRLNNANADLSPFGLTADLADLEDEEQAPVQKPKPTATLPKLTLGSYKDILKLR